MQNKTILITGYAEFIYANQILGLIKTNEPMILIGLDYMNDYYDVSMKEYRLSEIDKLAEENSQIKCTFIKGDLPTRC